MLAAPDGSNQDGLLGPIMPMINHIQGLFKGVIGGYNPDPWEDPKSRTPKTASYTTIGDLFLLGSSPGSGKGVIGSRVWGFGFRVSVVSGLGFRV